MFFQRIWSALMLVAAANTVQAQDLVDARNPDRLLSLLNAVGEASLGRDSSGDPKISGSIDGISYSVIFYGCVNGRLCDDIIFRAGWSGGSVPMRRINDWNRTKRYGKAFLDDDGDANIEMGINLDQGVSLANARDSIRWWQRALTGFKREVIDK